MGVRIAHRYAEPFLAACGARPPMTTAPDEDKVTCPECRALPSDPAAFAAHDQLRAAIRSAQALLRDASDLHAERCDDAIGELCADRDDWPEDFVPDWSEL